MHYCNSEQTVNHYITRKTYKLHSDIGIKFVFTHLTSIEHDVPIGKRGDYVSKVF